MARFRRIVHPTDFSPASGPAFRKAIELARENRATLRIAHVLPALPMLPDAYVAASTYDELLRGHRAEGDRQVQRLVKRARAAGVRASGAIVEFGATADAIARFARHERADLIVMGTRGHGALAKALLGSVAERVISRAPCPVMTVRGR